MRWRLGVLTALMLGMVLAACGSTSGSTEPITPSTTTTIPTVAEGSAGAWVEVASTTIDAGSELAATVVVVNRSGSPITVASCGVIYGAGPRTVLESHAKRADERIDLEDLRRATQVVARTLYDLLVK